MMRLISFKKKKDRVVIWATRDILFDTCLPCYIVTRFLYVDCAQIQALITNPGIVLNLR